MSTRGSPGGRGGHLLKVAYSGLVLSWAAAVGLALQIFDADAWNSPEAWIPFAVGTGTLAVLSAWPWHRTSRGPAIDLLAVAWAGVLLGGLWASHRLSGGVPFTVGFALIVVLAIALVVRPVTALVVTLAAIGVYYLALIQTGPDLGPLETGLRLGALAVTGALGWLLLWSLFGFLGGAQQRLAAMRATGAELRHRQDDLSRLYEISRSIGAGTTLTDVLPQMVGRIAGSIGATTGLVLLYDEAGGALEVISPIWVSGRALRAEGYILPLADQGLAQRVFVSSEADFLNDLSSAADPLLIDLTAEQVAAVPLRVDARSVGVLVVADKGSPFGAQDLERLESLATPAAMVVEHLAGLEEAREHGEKMTELARLKTDFVSVVSHELRTPLTSIIGSLATLSRPELAPSDPRAMQLLTTAQRQADRLKRLIEDLMMVSRLDQRSMPMRPEPIELGGFVRDVLRAIPKADGQVTIDLPEDLPALEADPEYLRRILTNLIENAIKYGQGSPVEMEARRSGPEIWMSVADHGPGIPYEMQDHIFERFTQVGPHETRSKGGTGLGLSIVRSLSETMGGRAWYEPTAGGGSTFSVALPLIAPITTGPTDRD